jgi:hypothetical protein
MLVAGMSACSTHPGLRGTAGDGPVVYEFAAPPDPQPSDNWVMPPLEAERIMRSCELRAQYQWPAGGGVTGARKVALYSPEAGKPFFAKWKAVPPRFESWNNSPRRELAAYEVQKLFLDPEDFIVPPSVIRCAPLDDYRAVIDATAKPSLPGAECVLGNLSLWLDNVRFPDKLYDEARFATDANYAMRMADFNLLTYLIDHKDGRRGNFIVSRNEADRRVFAIDNGISFDAWIWNYFVRNWNGIRVPALRKDSVDRLRHVDPAVIEGFAVLAELHMAPDGSIEHAEHSPPIHRKKGARVRDGVIQFGLTTDEVEDVFEKIAEILDGVDSGKIPVF